MDGDGVHRDKRGRSHTLKQYEELLSHHTQMLTVNAASAAQNDCRCTSCFGEANLVVSKECIVPVNATSQPCRRNPIDAWLIAPRPDILGVDDVAGVCVLDSGSWTLSINQSIINPTHPHEQINGPAHS